MGRILMAAVLWTTCTCSGDPRADLLLDLRTDLQPGLEFAEVRTELFERIPASRDRARAGNVEVRAVSVTDAFARGERIAVFTGLQPGRHVARVRLVDRQGVVILQRIALLTVRKTSVFTIVMTRDCRGVDCPGPDDDLSAIACLGGRCASAECTPETPEFCPTGVCEVDATCVAAAACAQAQCTGEGTCLRVGANGACPVGQWCDPDVGCVLLPDGPVDAGMDGTSDSGPTTIRATVQQSVLADITGVARNPRVDWTGSELGVAFQATRAGQERVYFTRRDTAGGLVGSEVTISTGTGLQPDVSWNPDSREFAFIWLTTIPGPSDVLFARYDETGVQIGSDTLVSSTGESFRQFVRWNGARYGIVYGDRGIGGYYAAVDATGGLAGTPVKVTGFGDCLCKVTLAWSGSAWGIVWTNDAGHRRDGQTGSELFFGTFDADGAAVGTAGFATDFADSLTAPGEAYEAHVVWAGDRFGVVWVDSRGGGREFFFTTLDETGNKLSEDVLLPALVRGFSSWLLWDGARFVVAYTGGTSPNQVVYLQWVTADAVPIGEPLTISDPATGMGAPAMVWTGTSYAVVWHQDPGVIALAWVTPE